ncbi:protoporphyrinogen/coproporphyrinogen oxidase [Actinomarinicola tropica]|uniref:NAD(P)-binding protein n=1 Tax=Actinomarinicola tropica TaxID=2789776 RepID=A0A5Q2RGN9_9ACTN|nr:FAD-dependent oxidoreductase [Actinomarinicola tropica]QGG95989.1 NAD(P)-binding protein [Actinomarinicola tropica]
MRHKAVVVGAGLAGLVAARELTRRGVECEVFEASSRIAGLAASERDERGFSYDVGVHFITNRLAAAVGVGAECRTVAQYGEAVWIRGRSYQYPLGLMVDPRYAFPAARAVLGGGGREPRTAREWFRGAYGDRLAEEIAIPLVEAWSGATADELAASVGGNIPSSIPHTLFLRAASRLTRRAVSLGYSHEAPEAAGVFHVYPEDGVVAICEALLAASEAELHLSTPVQGIATDGDTVVGVRAGDAEIEADLVVSTAPVHILPKIVSGTDRLDDLAGFRYRPMTFVNLFLDGRGLLPEVVVWTPEEHFPFFRLTEAPLSMPLQAPAGKTIVTCDIGCEVGDEVWTADEDALAHRCLTALEEIVPDIRGRHLGTRVVRTPIAYPVYLREYEERRKEFTESTGIDGLLSIGRNGEFAHILMEDVYWRTLRRVHDWAESNDAAVTV